MLNDTRDLYALFDATPFTAFLDDCVARTVKEDLPREIAEIEAYERARQGIDDLFNMADQWVSLLIRLVRQNGKRLSKGRRLNEFVALWDDEVEAVERVIVSAYEDTVTAPG